MLRIVLYLVCCFVLSNAATVSYITPCKPDDKPCMIASAQAAIPHVANGIPEFHVPVLDPISIESVRNDGKDLQLGFRNLQVYGTSKCKVIDLTRGLGSKPTISMTVECPLRSVGQYDLKGKLLFIEAFGDGDFEIKTNKVRIDVMTRTKEIEGADGKKHWKVTGFDYTYDLVEKVDFRLENLFGGDETRAKPILEVLEHSWKEIVTELGGPIIHELLSKAIQAVNKFFYVVPADNLEIA
ncbi:unnamed protein product [Leptosia nina]|uniref:Uncharacterized protein n=1 Tax=Leptosia nina TaxID=320188 RepID=A0AAV1K227_9NEOP